MIKTTRAVDMFCNNSSNSSKPNKSYEIDRIINKKANLYIDYKFHKNKYHKKIMPYDEINFTKHIDDKELIKYIEETVILNNDNNSTIKLEKIIISYDLFMSIGIINAIRPNSVYIETVDNFPILRHIIIDERHNSDSSIMLITKNTRRFYNTINNPDIKIYKGGDRIYLNELLNSYSDSLIMIFLRSSYLNEYNYYDNKLVPDHNNFISITNAYSCENKGKRHISNYVNLILQLLRLSACYTTSDNDIISYLPYHNQTYFDVYSLSMISPIKINSELNATKSKIKCYSSLFNIMEMNNIINSETELYNKNSKYIKNIKKLVYLLYSCDVPCELILILLSFL